MQKIKANGFNTISFYVNWALHYPTPDTGNGDDDWKYGTYRDLQAYINEAKKARQWIIARLGPYIMGKQLVGDVGEVYRPATSLTWSADSHMVPLSK
ncbi:hypothetical protein BJ138DRAFT_630348 [Hygrophoropsis aurantiaca]|uniref:Uncharacterized protein n=1 Tax=Hygrophoropsis aurantiaca TaxID=72124 RepID=A0ACB8A0H8_9AGAM|nr:hypothetical protein BJ138DRAFT_630348 [Hygrophoropsis aurantiaca]